ncbi:hypothetical protein GCE86_23800 [Micromonospora terminaliae]|uniref:Uncharacterized protein n=1 Tax=Micromonospora terminaliae TaxID=1914461 RepID=A0AAJ3DLZ8_9ACTN|nr:hypothetical protein [Micromonospora terminaliae]NES31397.1 hypothetical protein [Micromonospora terminaliae]QGL49784.1 hypothetical protein GCE86_23800 [Micromonospora terminaliae]
MASDERIRGALLAGLAVVALVAGAGWWRAAAPVLGRTGPDPAPSTGAFLEPGVRVAVDPATGQVLPGPEADPDEPVVIEEKPDGVPRWRDVSHTVWREQSRLMPDGAPVTRRANASDGARFLLTVSCSGPGTVFVGFTGSSEDDTEQGLSCGGPADRVVVSARGGPLLVRFAAVRDQVDLDARLDALD